MDIFNPIQYLSSIVLVGLLVFSNFAYSQGNSEKFSPSSLKKLSIEELMEIEVTSVSKRPEKLSGTASAIQIITSEDIHHSAATRLPEVLRLAPNLQIGQSSSFGWSITARGFNGAPVTGSSLANKLLVMIDGRTIYSPLFAGVFWDTQDVLLEDIDRIEVVSGPGASLWGANAVNGVINILRKSAKNTQGFYATGAAGTFLNYNGGLRYGGKVGDNLYYRVYLQRMSYDNTVFTDSINANDDWGMTQGGFRVDYLPSEKNTFVLQGDFYEGKQSDPATYLLDGQNILAEWKHTFTEASNFTLQVYFDRTWRDRTETNFREELNTYDVDLQHVFKLGERQKIVWGGGYRYMQDNVTNSQTSVFDPEDLNFDFINAFIQNQITVIPEHLNVTLGIKFSDNHYSGLGIQPNGRISWQPNETNTIWAAVSRALRSASRFDADFSRPIIGKKDFNWEKVIAYELSYKVMPVKTLSLSLATFYNDYEDLRSLDFVAPAYVFENHHEATSWGLELSGTLQAMDWWKLRGGYTYLNKSIRNTSDNVIEGSSTLEGLDPNHQALLQSMMDLPGNFSLDIVARYVDNLPASTLLGTNEIAPATPAYFNMDVRLGWQSKNIEFALAGQNLLKDENQEFGNNSIPRNLYLKVSCHF